MEPISRTSRRLPPVIAWLLVLGAAETARADENVAALMTAPASYTDVADAFEPGDPLDVNVRLSYIHDVSSGVIQREVVDPNVRDGRRHVVDVAEHSQVRKELGLRLEVGVYHDVMVYMRVPIVLSDDSQLDAARGSCDGTNASAACTALRERQADGTSQPLFELAPSAISARRSGLPSLDVGAAWSIIDQYRTPQLATWVVIAEASIDTGAVMRPCLSGQRSCEPGVSRGTDRLKLESRWSYRYRHVEPLIGVSHTFVWLGQAEELYHPRGELANVSNDGPPSITEATFGSAFVPWEDRTRHQRVELELRASAALISAGRDYSPLFDALGTSMNPYLAQNTVIGAISVPFTGITQVDAHARLGLEGSAAIQAARYVRFALGAGFTHLTPHMITGASPCSTAAAGTCPLDRVNPVYRSVIDAPGNRFRLAGAVGFRLQLSATAQF